MMNITVTAADQSLFHVASVHLGDAAQWWRIAQLNGLSDPDLSGFAGPVSLRMPQAVAGAGDGIPALQG